MYNIVLFVIVFYMQAGHMHTFKKYLLSYLRNEGKADNK